MDADLTLSFASFMALSGKPTISKQDNLFDVLHSTVTIYPSMPKIPAL
jgi:hypothetical protein